MPRPKHRADGGSYFAVSPWQDKQALEGDASDAAQPAQPGYSVVEVPLVVGDAAPAAAAATAGPAASRLIDSQPAAAAVPTAAAGGWQVKKRKPADEAHASTASANELGGGARPLEAGAAAGMAGGEQPPAGPGQLELEGTAYLALLPNGSVTGGAGCAAGPFPQRPPPMRWLHAEARPCACACCCQHGQAGLLAL